MDYQFDPLQAEKLHTLRGYRICVSCTRTVRAERLALVSSNDERTVSVKLIYMGAAENASARLRPANDPHTYTKLFSPFPEAPAQYVANGFFQDKLKFLWMTYFSDVFIKDPAIYHNGLKIVFEVPEILAEKAPEFAVFCNGEKVYTEILTESGTHAIVISLKSVNLRLIKYMHDTRRQQYIILDELNRLCKKYSLNFYLICGGLIGALRDGSLIPWDDDIDIAMLRNDYDRLKDAAKQEWKNSSDFLWLDFDDLNDGTDKDIFLDYMTRILYMKEKSDSDAFSRLGENGRKDIRFHLPVDIYILDNASGGRLLHFLKTRKIQLLYVMSLGHRPGFDPKEHKEFNRTTLFTVKLLSSAGKKIPLKKLNTAYRKTLASLQKKSTGNVFQSNGYFRCVPMLFKKEWFNSGRYINLSGIKLQIPENAEDFLKKMYGDYLQYPPVCDRRPMHLDEDFIKPVSTRNL